MAFTRVYCKGVLEAEGFPVADVSDHLERPDTVVWVDLCGPSIDQLHELADELGLHELAVEDALGPHQRPKIDRYATHAFLSCHSVRVNIEAGRARRDGDRRVHLQALAHHRAQGRQLPHGAGPRPLGPVARPRHPRRRLPALRAPRRGGGRLLRRRASARRLLRRDQRRRLLREPAPADATAPLVRDAAGAGAVPPARHADARDGQRVDATRAPRHPRARCSPTTRTCTTTSCG